MANITTYNQFVEDINVPGTERASLELYIAKYEPKLLAEILGYELAVRVIKSFDDAETQGDSFDIWNGKEFTDKHGRLNKWPGFRSAGYNPIAFFVYCKWKKDNVSYTSSTGEKRGKSTNADNTETNTKIRNAWNQMVDLLLILDDFLVQNISKYPKYVGRSTSIEDYGNKAYYTKRNALSI